MKANPAIPLLTKWGPGGGGAPGWLCGGQEIWDQDALWPRHSRFHCSAVSSSESWGAAGGEINQKNITDLNTKCEYLFVIHKTVHKYLQKMIWVRFVDHTDQNPFMDILSMPLMDETILVVSLEAHVQRNFQQITAHKK